MNEGLDWIDFREPWMQCPDGLEAELRKEVSPAHVLFGVDAVSVARRTDNDDVLFQLKDFDKRFAVVHLTWAGRADQDPQFPFTRFYDSVESWVDGCMRTDSAEFATPSKVR